MARRRKIIGSRIMIDTAAGLQRALAERGLLPAEVNDNDPIAREETQDRPWYISLLLGLSGWIAGLFLLGFVGAVYFSVTQNATIAGVILLVSAWALFRVDVEGAFVSQLALALSIAGQFALLFGLSDNLALRRSGDIAAIALVLQIALVALMPSRMHRSMSALFATIAWVVFIRSLYGNDLFGGFSTRQPLESPSLTLALSSWALAWAPIGIALYFAVVREPLWMASRWCRVIRPAAIGLAAGLAWATLFSHPFESLRFADATREGWLAIWPLLSAMAAVAALAAGFALKHRALMGAAMIAALLHVSHFYYAMGTTLLIKSVVMVAIGVLLLVAARALNPRGSAT
jgi:Domain of unknown function (DUF4401)